MKLLAEHKAEVLAALVNTSHEAGKGAAQEPYMNHLIEVASLVAEATHGEDPDLVIAALLHDAIEDCEVPSELIAREFGERVARLVQEVSDDKTLPKEVRKEIQIQTASEKSQDAKIIKLADKTSNQRTMAFSPPVGWSINRRLKYIAWSKEVVAELRDASPWLEQQFDVASAEAEHSIAVRPGKV